MGQVVGESSARAEVPRRAPICPRDLVATVFRVLGINGQQRYVGQSGRSQYQVPEGGRPIADLV
jgi:hypothetical protein